MKSILICGMAVDVTWWVSENKHIRQSCTAITPRQCVLLTVYCLHGHLQLYLEHLSVIALHLLQQENDDRPRTEPCRWGNLFCE
jgi:hypothetical protein